MDYETVRLFSKSTLTCTSPDPDKPVLLKRCTPQITKYKHQADILEFKILLIVICLEFVF